MAKTMMIKPGRDLLQRVNQAFLDYGYSGLSMVTMAKACGFTQRALYYYFNNKEDAFRAMINYRNEEAIQSGLEAGKAVRAKGGSALEIIAEDPGHPLRRHTTEGHSFAPHGRTQCRGL